MRTLLALLVLAPTLALAQPADPTPPADWTLGAGLTLGELLVSSSFGVSPLVASVPSVSASLERAISDRTWLVFGISAFGMRERYELPASAASSSGTLRDQDTAGGAAEFGFRGAVTPAAAIVSVSWLASFEAGFAHTARTFTSSAGDLSDRYDVRYVGGSVGLAVERTLGERLAVRLATPLARVQYGTTEARPQMGDITKGTLSGVALVIAPRLELRVAF